MDKHACPPARRVPRDALALPFSTGLCECCGGFSKRLVTVEVYPSDQTSYARTRHQEWCFACRSPQGIFAPIHERGNHGRATRLAPRRQED